MNATRIKICGLTRAEDAAAAVAAGADAIGVVLAPSKRQVSLEQAARVLEAVPPLVARVGVFVNAHPDEVAGAVVRLGLHAVQFHGDESPETCAAAPAPVIKALRIRGRDDLAAAEAFRGAVSALLLDTLVAGERGGSGVSFDWYDVEGALPRWAPVLVAGGLRPSSVGVAVGALHPFAVDVSSGVESAPGVKDHRLMHEFVAAVRAADEEVSHV